MESNFSTSQQLDFLDFTQHFTSHTHAFPTSTWSGGAHLSTQLVSTHSPSYTDAAQYAAHSNASLQNTPCQISIPASHGLIDAQTAALCASLTMQDLLRLRNPTIFNIFNELSITKAALSQCRQVFYSLPQALDNNSLHRLVYNLLLQRLNTLSLSPSRHQSTGHLLLPLLPLGPPPLRSQSNALFWNCNDYRREHGKNAMVTTYLQHPNGTLWDKDTISTFSTFMRQMFTSMHNARCAPTKPSDIDADTYAKVQSHAYTEYPSLRFCANHWWLLFWIRTHYPSWCRNFLKKLATAGTKGLLAEALSGIQMEPTLEDGKDADSGTCMNNIFVVSLLKIAFRYVKR
jgi:hypothetical protein